MTIIRAFYEARHRYRDQSAVTDPSLISASRCFLAEFAVQIFARWISTRPKKRKDLVVTGGKDHVAGPYHLCVAIEMSVLVREE
ncbi:MAG TPA: hypothetical protein VEF89_10920 [Solirubrobacteraceae bacterium]|nr:hypothetical protein [Solirubrobacteraceae bacterium]